MQGCLGAHCQVCRPSRAASVSRFGFELTRIESSNPIRPATSSLANWLGINRGCSETPLNAALCDRALDCSSRQNRPKPVSEPFRLTTSGLCRGEIQRFPGSLSTLVRIQAGPVLQVLPTGSPAHPVIPAGDVLRRSRRDFAALMPSCRLLWVYPPLAPLSNGKTSNPTPFRRLLPRYRRDRNTSPDSIVDRTPKR